MNKILNHFRFQFFQLIEKCSKFLNKTPEISPQHHSSVINVDPRQKYLWVFASTIGELNAIEPLIVELLLEESNNDGLVILTDHPHYTDAFLRVFPEAIIIDHGIYGDTVNETDRYTPFLFVLAEIPCLLFDAPCRFSYRVI